MSRPRFPRTILVSLCDGSRAPIYVLDGSGMLVYGNPAFHEVLSIGSDDLVGRICRWQSPPPHPTWEESLVAQLCPPPEISAGYPGPFPWHVTLADGTELHRSAWGMPLGNSQEDNGLLVVLGLKAPTVEKSSSTTDPRVLHEYLLHLNRGEAIQFRVDSLAGESPWQQRIRQQVAMAVRSGGPISIVAADGMDAESLARIIHTGDLTADTPPLAVVSSGLLDADALQTTLLTLTHSSNSSGIPSKGTLVLTEIEQLSPDAQRWLAREFTNLSARVRILSTSKSDLMQLADMDRFDRELACLQACFTIRVPDLMDRMEDIPYLAQQIIESLNEETGRHLSGLSPDALELLHAHTWPGQLGELRKRIREAYVESKGPWLKASDFNQVFRDAMGAAPPPYPPAEPMDLEQLLRDVEVRYLRRAVELADGNKAQAARLVGMNRAKFLRRWEQLVEEKAAPLSPEDPPDDSAALEDLV